MSRSIELRALAALLLALSGCHRQPAAPDALANGTSVIADGFTLTSAATELPAADQPFPPGPGFDAVTGNCASCHSPSMILAQPPLKAEQWEAEVKKMREVYKAPVADADVPAILDYLNALSAAHGGGPTAR